MLIKSIWNDKNLNIKVTNENKTEVRFLWFRECFPNAIIETTIEFNENSVLIKAMITEEKSLISIVSMLSGRDDANKVSEIALDKAIKNLGFVFPEEVGYNNNDESENSKEIEPDVQSSDDSLSFSSVTKINSGELLYDSSTPVDEIISMLDEKTAREYVCTAKGKFAGKTVGEIYDSDKDENGKSNICKFFTEKYAGKDNILIACCKYLNENNY